MSVNQQVAKFAGYAGAKLIGRVAIGAGFGAMGAVYKYGKGGVWAIAAAGITGGLIGGLTNAYSDYRQIQRIENQYIQNVSQCAIQNPGPGGSE